MTAGHIDATDSVVADLLAGILELLADSGGWLHPDARLVERDGHLSLSCTAADGEPLVRVPHRAMVPVGRIAWSVEPEALAFDALPDDFDERACELAYVQVALLNRCGKIPSLHQSHPLLAPLSPRLIESIRAFRPSFRTEPIDPASLLWSTRCFRLTIGASAPEPVAIPVVDLLDHHCDGATGVGRHDAFEVAIRRPRGDQACFLDYGWRRDAIGMAVVYGFADASADIAHSAPICLEEASTGQINVLAKGRDAAGHLVPMQATASASGITISHVDFGAGCDPVRELMGATGWDTTRAGTVIEAIAAANLALLEDLHLAAMTDRGPAPTIMADAAVRQAEVIRTFPEHVGDGSLT